mgnify:CR=1 FL=1
MVEQTPLETLRQMNEQVGKSKKGSARTRKRIGKDAETFMRKQLRSLVNEVSRRVEKEVVPVVKGEKENFRLDNQDAVYTTDGWADRIIAAIRAVAAQFSEELLGETYERIAQRTVSMAESESTDAFLKSVNEAAGVDMSAMLDQEGIQEYVEAANRQNVQLVKSVPQQQLDRIENAVLGGVRDGATIGQIIKQIRGATNTTRNQATRIARDQTAKLQSEITERRQRQSGIKFYQSIDVGDERVAGRPDGKFPNAKISCWGIARKDTGFGPGVYKWNEGAEWNGVKGLHPGRHHVNCFPAGTQVHAEEVEKIYKRWYSGRVIILQTDNYGPITATPNHPFLTKNGWKGADDIVLGESVYISKSYGHTMPIENICTGEYDEIDIDAHAFHGDGQGDDTALISTDVYENTNYVCGDTRVGYLELETICHKEIQLYEGHVYNLQTRAGVYNAKGFFVSNCRCTAKPIFEWELPDNAKK